MADSAWVWFTLLYFGLPVVILHGGLSAMQDLPPQSAQYSGHVFPDTRSRRGGFDGESDPEKALLQVQVFDARTAAEFSGLVVKGNARVSQLPRAALPAHGELLDEAGLKSKTELAQLLDRADVSFVKLIAIHCQVSGRAALAALAAVIVGRRDVRGYHPSFEGWAADESCPIRLPD